MFNILENNLKVSFFDTKQFSLMYYLLWFVRKITVQNKLLVYSHFYNLENIMFVISSFYCV